jgi:choloylglycine hydrolase
MRKRRMMMHRIVSIVLILLSFSFYFAGTCKACSVFRVIAKDGTIISGRTMEFGYDLKDSIIVVPRNKQFTSPAPNNKQGLTWKTKYGYVATNAFGEEGGINDGLNETGLAFSALWYEEDMKWQDVGPHETNSALANIGLGTWILGNFSSVDEVKIAITKVKVFGLYVPQMGIVPPSHIIVYDAKGGCIVVEYENGEPRIYDNPLGIMTNAPNFPWMVTNLRNYIGMSDEKLTAKVFSGIKLSPTGHGSGMWGLPGDITPPSRFVRLAVMTHFADQQENAEKTLNLAQHIVSAIHIVRGMVVDRAPDGKIVSSETTQWSSFRDLTNRVYYFRTYDNFNLRKIDLKKLDFNASKVKSIPMTGDTELMLDITDRIK